MPNDRPQNPAGLVVGSEPQNPVVAQNSVAPQEPVGNPPVASQDPVTQRDFTATRGTGTNIPNMLNNVNNSNLLTSVGLGGSDVTLPGAQPKNNKRLFVIIAVIVGLVLLGVVLWFALTRLNSGTVSKADANNGFNKYANFLAYGTEETKNLEGEYSSGEIYSAEYAFRDENVDYFKKLNNYWNNYYDLAEKSGTLNDNTELVGAIEYQNEMMDFINNYYEVGSYTEEELLTLYVDKGEQAAYDEIDKRYEPLSISDNDLSHEYATAVAQENKDLIRLLAAYESAGCLNNKMINEECVARDTTASLLEEEYEKWLDDEQLDLAYNTVSMLVRNCWNIANRMVNGDE